MRRRGCWRRPRQRVPVPSAARRACQQRGLAPGPNADGECEVERAALPDFAIDPDAAAVQCDKTLGNGEAETRAAVPPRRGAVGLAELVEDVGLRLRRDADAGVGD